MREAEHALPAGAAHFDRFVALHAPEPPPDAPAAAGADAAAGGGGAPPAEPVVTRDDVQPYLRAHFFQARLASNMLFPREREREVAAMSESLAK